MPIQIVKILILCLISLTPILAFASQERLLIKLEQEIFKDSYGGANAKYQAYAFPQAEKIWVISNDYSNGNAKRKKPKISAYDLDGNKLWDKEIEVWLYPYWQLYTLDVSPTGKHIVLTRQNQYSEGYIMEMATGKIIYHSSTPVYATRTLFGSGDVKFSTMGNYILVDSGEGVVPYSDEGHAEQWEPDKICLLETATGKVIWCRKEKRGVKNLVVLETNKGPVVQALIPSIKFDNREKDEKFDVHKVSRDGKRLIFTKSRPGIPDKKTYLGSLDQNNRATIIKQINISNPETARYEFLTNGLVFTVDVSKPELLVLGSDGAEIKRTTPKRVDCQGLDNAQLSNEGEFIYWFGGYTTTGTDGCDQRKEYPKAADLEGNVLYEGSGTFYPLGKSREYIAITGAEDKAAGKHYFEIYRGALPKSGQ